MLQNCIWVLFSRSLLLTGFKFLYASLKLKTFHIHLAGIKSIYNSFRTLTLSLWNWPHNIHLLNVFTVLRNHSIIIPIMYFRNMFMLVFKHVIIPPRFLQSSFSSILFQSSPDLKWRLDWIKSCSMLQSCQSTGLLLTLYLAGLFNNIFLFWFWCKSKTLIITGQKYFSFFLL